MTTQASGTSEGGEFRKKFEDLQEKAKVIPTLEQENALLRLGIDPDAGKAKLFRNAYKGEWTPDAVKEGLAEFDLADLLPQEGGEQQQTDPAEDQARQQEAAAISRMAGASAGAPTLPGSGEGLDFSDCNSPEEVMAKLQAAGRPLADLD